MTRGFFFLIFNPLFGGKKESQEKIEENEFCGPLFYCIHFKNANLKIL